VSILKDLILHFVQNKKCRICNQHNHDIGALKLYIMENNTNNRQGHRQKIFQGEPTEKRPKNSKKCRKIALFSLFQEGPTKKKTEK